MRARYRGEWGSDVYVRDLVVGLFRRWYLVLAGLLLTAAMGAGVFALVPVTYQAKASVLLLPPRTSLGKNGNPYLYLGGLNQALGILSTRMNAPDYRSQLESSFPDATLEVAQDTTTTGPILTLSSSAHSPQKSMQLMEVGLSTTGPALQSLQDQLDIPAGSRIGLMTLTTDSRPVRDTKNQLRAIVAISAVGLGGTLLTTALIDGWLLGRPRPRVLNLGWWRRSNRGPRTHGWDWSTEEQANTWRREAGDDADPRTADDDDVPDREDVVVGERRD